MLRIHNIINVFLYSTLVLALVLLLRFMVRNEERIVHEAVNLSHRISGTPIIPQVEEDFSDYEEESFRAFIHDQEMNKDIEDIEDIKIEDENGFIYLDESKLK